MTIYSPRTRTAKARHSYNNIGLQTEVLSASPERLISLLFRGALSAIGKAQHHMATGNIQERGNAISKAIEIVDAGLKAGLDAKQGGEIAKNLQLSYEIIIHNLMLANLHSDGQKLVLAKNMLTDLSDAWKTAVDPQFELV